MSRRRPDAGESLVEILLSITIMSIALVALLAGMGTAATTAGLNARQTGQVQGLQSFAQAVLDAPYVACATTYSPAGYVDPSGYTLSVGNVRYQQTGGWTAAGGAVYGATCPSPDQGSQQMRVIVHQADGRVADESVVIVKRRPCASTDPSC